MNEHSWGQRLLHRLALGTQLVRETTLDVAQMVAGEQPSVKDKQHVFVAGLARSGTTALLRALHESDQFASQTYADMPFVLAPNLWPLDRQKVEAGTSSERAHGDGILVNASSPEAFEEVFWKTAMDLPVAKKQPEVVLTGDLSMLPSDELTEKFHKYVDSIAAAYQRERYLSKNNGNIVRLHWLHHAFPNATVLVPFRHPDSQAASLFQQHQHFCKAQSEDSFVLHYMNSLGHHEFGLGRRPYLPAQGILGFTDATNIDHWYEQWLLAYSSMLKLIEQKHDWLVPVCYEIINDASTDNFGSLCEFLQVEKPDNPDLKVVVRDPPSSVQADLRAECIALYDKLCESAYKSK